MNVSLAAPNLSKKHPKMFFEEFFELGQQETSSPFITQETRHWGLNLPLKTAVLSAVFLLTAFVLSWYPQWMPFSYLSLALVYFLAGVPSLIESIEEIAAYEINIDVLMTLAAFSSVLIGSSMEGGLLLVLFALSGSMEEYVTTRAKSSISSLHKLSPTKACVVGSDGTLMERSIKDIPIGTLILIKSGQIVPLDGIVVDGVSSVNLVHLTGENMPLTKQANDEVPAGARNMEGVLTLRVTRLSSDSTLARIIQLVTQAQSERPILQKWFDKLSKAYAITIISAAGFFSVALPLIYHIPFLGEEGSVYRSLAFLIAASPCALIIALPIAYLSAIGSCARQGILLKGGISLDALASCSVVAFDKTGTLTKGQLVLEGIDSIGNDIHEDTREAMLAAYALEKNAVHPIAKAIVAYGQERKLQSVALSGFKAIPGYGLSASVHLSAGKHDAYIGNPDFILPKISKEKGDQIKKAIASAQANGELVAVLLLADKLFLLRFRDTPREGIAAAIHDLKDNLKLKLIMLTGDHESSAKKISAEVGIDKYYANLKPEDKLRYVSEIAADDNLAMIGDGINDAPALARATVGICMGKVGSTAALDAADIVLLHDNIEQMGWLFRKARLTQSIVKQNLTLATAAIVIASIPALAGLVPLWLAVILHEGGTVLVGLNGLRLLTSREKNTWQ